MKTIHHRCLSIALAALCLGTTAHAQPPRIDPAGINGALLLCGRGEVSQPALERFITLAQGDMAKVVIVASKKTAPALIERLQAAASKAKAAPADVVLLDGPKENLPKLADLLRGATGVWLTAETVGLDVGGEPLEALLRRSGVLAANGPASELVAQARFRHDGAMRKGMNLLPEAILVARDPHQKDSGLAALMKIIGTVAVGYQIEPESALLVKGRSLSAVGTGVITAHLPANEIDPARPITIAGKTQADLTVLRRAVRDRRQPFPPRKVDAPVVEKGTLIIVGGGGLPEGLFQKFIECAGGPGKAKIVVFPTANVDPLPRNTGLAVALRKAGAAKVTVLPGKTQADVESKEFLDVLRDATGLWFDGGRQWRYVDCYEDTKALPLMFDVLQRGGVIAGSSAGATIQGDYLCRGGVFDNFDIRYEGYERGLGFLKGVAIDQHFSQRKRQKDMTKLMKRYPQYLGIGLDEATAIIVKGQTADVIGRGRAHFYDALRKMDREPDYEALPAGSQYDLKERKVLKLPQAKTAFFMSPGWNADAPRNVHVNHGPICIGNITVHGKHGQPLSAPRIRDLLPR